MLKGFLSYMIIVIWWVVKCFVLDCLKWKLIKKNCYFYKFSLSVILWFFFFFIKKEISWNNVAGLLTGFIIQFMISVFIWPHEGWVTQLTVSGVTWTKGTKSLFLKLFNNNKKNVVLKNIHWLVRNYIFQQSLVFLWAYN